MKFFILFCLLFLFSACVQMPPQARCKGCVDECNFHMGQYGKGLRWRTLPVPITLHAESMHQPAINTTLKVIDEWNHTWKSDTQSQTELFEVVGAIHYNEADDTMRDDHNSIVMLSTRNQGSLPSVMLLPDRVGVTQTLGGRMYLSEADIYLNEEVYDFYYEDQELVGQKPKEYSRYLASLSAPQFEVKSLFERFLKWIMFWKKESGREIAAARVPRGKVDFESVVSHELGHVLSLGHNNKPGSIMQEGLEGNQVRRGLRPIDIDSLRCHYAKQNEG